VKRPRPELLEEVRVLRLVRVPPEDILVEGVQEPVDRAAPASPEILGGGQDAFLETGLGEGWRRDKAPGEEKN
jgi:hypothetical protein